MKHYCVIGFPIGHSRSPAFHNRAFKKLKIAADYIACEVVPRSLGAFMKKFRANFDGANVTIPHKEKIIQYLDWLSPEARLVGAVNTIVHRGEKLLGYNTDVVGVQAALKNGGVRLGKSTTALVLGAGGAARAVVCAIVQAGGQVTLLNRTVARARRLARAFPGLKAGISVATTVDDLKKTKERFNLIINATSVGLNDPAATPLPQLRELLAAQVGMRSRIAVMDSVYTPRRTRFLRDAQKCGASIIYGEEMFAAQAKASFFLWTARRYL